jgi:phospholipase/carboxylesterase
MRRESTLDEEAQVGLKFVHRAGSGSDAPLLVMVHGRAGDRHVMWTFERVVPPSWHIVSFQAFEPEPIGGWSWWQMGENGGRRPAIHQAARRLAHAVRSFCQVRGIAPSKRVGIGFSQGGVLVSTGTFAGFLEFEAIAVLAGFVALPNGSNELSRKPKVFIAHGSEDDVIPVERARSGVEALKGLGVEVEYVEESVKHKVGIQGTRALGNWLAALS